MKLVIDIDEKHYLAYKELSERSLYNGEYVKPLEHIIGGGVPLQDFLKVSHEERPHGEWLWIDDVDDPLDQFHRYKCSECGRIIRVYNWPTFSDYPFCHCGADMRVKEELNNDQ